MKIALVTPRFHTYLYYRIKAIEKAGHMVKVFALYKGVSEYHKNMDVTIVNESLFFRMISKLFKIFKKTYLKSDLELKLMSPGKIFTKKIINYKPDLILVESFMDVLLHKTIKLAKKINTKIIILLVSKKNNIKGSVLLLKLYLSFLKRNNVISYITPIKINEVLYNELGITNIHYLPLVFPAEDFNKLYFRNNRINIISVGKFVKRKEQILLLKVINNLKDKYGLYLTLIGEKSDLDYLNEINNYINQNNLNKIVDIKYNITYEKILNEYKKYDIFILPSYNEPVGYVINEAMANKLPVICADDCGGRCYIEEGRNGYIFKTRDENSLLSNIEKVIKNKNNIIKMGNTSFEFSKKRHSIDIFGKNFNRVLQLYY